MRRDTRNRACDCDETRRHFSEGIVRRRATTLLMFGLIGAFAGGCAASRGGPSAPRVRPDTGLLFNPGALGGTYAGAVRTPWPVIVEAPEAYGGTEVHVFFSDLAGIVREGKGAGFSTGQTTIRRVDEYRSGYRGGSGR